MNRNERAEAERVGQCVVCRHGRPQASPRAAQRFWRCDRSDDDPRYPRYPRIPVQDCPGFGSREPSSER